MNGSHRQRARLAEQTERRLHEHMRLKKAEAVHHAINEFEERLRVAQEAAKAASDDELPINAEAGSLNSDTLRRAMTKGGGLEGAASCDSRSDASSVEKYKEDDEVSTTGEPPRRLPRMVSEPDVIGKKFRTGVSPPSWETWGSSTRSKLHQSGLGFTQTGYQSRGLESGHQQMWIAGSTVSDAVRSSRAHDLRAKQVFQSMGKRAEEVQLERGRLSTWSSYGEGGRGWHDPLPHLRHTGGGVGFLQEGSSSMHHEWFARAADQGEASQKPDFFARATSPSTMSRRAMGAAAQSVHDAQRSIQAPEMMRQKVSTTYGESLPVDVVKVDRHARSLFDFDRAFEKFKKQQRELLIQHNEIAH